MVEVGQKFECIKIIMYIVILVNVEIHDTPMYILTIETFTKIIRKIIRTSDGINKGKLILIYV